MIIKGTTFQPLYVMPDMERIEINLKSYPTLTFKMTRTSEGGMDMFVEDRKHIDNRVTVAYNDFMKRLFGYVPVQPEAEEVDRDRYAEEMHIIQRKYGLLQGDPDFLEWMLTLVGRSPVLTSEGKVVYDERQSEDGDTATTMG